MAGAERPRPLARFLKQFNDILIFVLLAAGAGTAWLGEWVDTWVILGVVLINALIGFVQEGKAEAALAAISNMMTPEASVLRDGLACRIPAHRVVPGDIVLLAQGGLVPADLRLLDAKSLAIQEAVLTGESVPSAKQEALVAQDCPLADRSSMAYAGTLVAQGHGRGVAVATGMATEMGRIGKLLQTVKPLETPLLRRMAVFGNWLALFILVLSCLTFALGFLVHGQSIEAMFMAAVALAVAAVPEGLPAVLTIAMAVGVQRMARRNALIRKLPAVETLGSVTAICTDKTGTLTRNEMTVRDLVLADGKAQTWEEPSARALLEAAVLCSDATAGHGSPTELAILEAGRSAGLDMAGLRASWPRQDEIPFDSSIKLMAVLLEPGNAGKWAEALVKGAPDRVLAMASFERGQEGTRPIDRAFWLERVEELAGQGERVLAVARRALPEGEALTLGSLAGLEVLGLIGIADPPRPEAKQAVQQCRAAGIRVIMITGDHGATALAIGREIELSDDPSMLTGAQIDALDETGLRQAVRSASIFARTTPEHKLRLVEALQAEGEVVAMTGDGVNDAPALKRAEIGVAMGASGTEAAKEAALMVLADDNFATIAHAVEEGRGVYDNIVKSIAYLLPTNAAQALVLAAAVLFGQQLPVTPVQILWINLVTAITLGMALAFEPALPDVMRRPPRPLKAPLISRLLLKRMTWIALLMVLAVFAIFELALRQSADVALARTAAANTLIACEIAYLLAIRSEGGQGWRLSSLRASPAAPLSILMMILLQAAFTYAPPMQHFFKTASQPTALWLPILGCSLVIFAAAVLAERRVTISASR